MLHVIRFGTCKQEQLHVLCAICLYIHHYLNTYYSANETSTVSQITIGYPHPATFITAHY